MFFKFGTLFAVIGRAKIMSHIIKITYFKNIFLFMLAFMDKIYESLLYQNEILQITLWTCHSATTYHTNSAHNIVVV